jgi:hypothetical protein
MTQAALILCEVFKLFGLSFRLVVRYVFSTRFYSPETPYSWKI